MMTMPPRIFYSGKFLILPMVVPEQSLVNKISLHLWIIEKRVQKVNNSFYFLFHRLTTFLLISAMLIPFADLRISISLPLHKDLAICSAHSSIFNFISLSVNPVIPILMILIIISNFLAFLY